MQSKVIGQYNPSIRITAKLVTPLKWALISYMRGVFDKLFHGKFINSELLLEICWEEIADEIFLLYCVLKLDRGYEPEVTSNKPVTYYSTMTSTQPHFCILCNTFWAVFSNVFDERFITNMTYITYICNWTLQPFCLDYDLVPLNTYIKCVNFIFIHEWRDVQFKVDSEWNNFAKLYMADK